MSGSLQMQACEIRGAAGFALAPDGAEAMGRLRKPFGVCAGPSPDALAWYEAAYEGAPAEDAEGIVRCSARIDIPHGPAFSCADAYRPDPAGTLELTRTVRVDRGADGWTFASLFSLELPGSEDDYHWFSPGLWYFDNEHVSPLTIGSKALRGRLGHTWALFREDRCTAPLFVAYHRPSSRAVGLLHRDPEGGVPPEDDDAPFLCDAGLSLGSLGLWMGEGSPRLVFSFPASEGEITYPACSWRESWDTGFADLADGDDPLAHANPARCGWSHRHHPARSGFVQGYRLELWGGPVRGYASALSRAWRHAWRAFAPRVRHVDLHRVACEGVDLLSRLVRRGRGGSVGIPSVVGPRDGRAREPHLFGIGFTQRNILGASLLLKAGHEEGRPHYLEQGRAIVDFWTRSAPGEPFHDTYNAADGTWMDAGLWSEKQRGQAFLRSVVEGHHAALWAYAEELRHGTRRTDWLDWAVGFGDWLVAHQNDDGSYFRMYHADGRPAWRDKAGSYCPVPFLVALEGLTGRVEFLDAALRVGVYLQEHGHREGRFVGGTIDNPNCYDKEACALSLEAYLALYERTRDAGWLEAARLAADFCETWIYAWDVPVPGGGAHHRALPPGRPTVGVQLICLGHSLCDMYLAFNPGEFAKLARYTGDRHYREVAEILLHNTKGMMDLDGALGYFHPGCQSEHWCLSRGRGRGVEEIWLPWVTTSHLLGMKKVMDFCGSYDLDERAPVRTDLHPV